MNKKEDKKVFYVDVGDKSPEELKEALKEIKEELESKKAQQFSGRTDASKTYQSWVRFPPEPPIYRRIIMLVLRYQEGKKAEAEEVKKQIEAADPNAKVILLEGTMVLEVIPESYA